MARTEKDFLNTMDTYIKVTKDRLRDGRVIDAHEELIIMEKMVGQRIEEIEGNAKWEAPEGSIVASRLKRTLREICETQKAQKDFGAEMLKKLTEGRKTDDQADLHLSEI